jgi:hypothetical protein
LINALVYLPSLLDLYLAVKEREAAATATIVNGLLIALAFAKIHIWGASLLPYWGIWNRSFFVLEADSISWTILSVTVAVAIGIALIGSFVKGRLSVLKERHKREAHIFRSS